MNDLSSAQLPNLLDYEITLWFHRFFSLDLLFISMNKEKGKRKEENNPAISFSSPLSEAGWSGGRRSRREDGSGQGLRVSGSSSSSSSSSGKSIPSNVEGQELGGEIT